MKSKYIVLASLILLSFLGCSRRGMYVKQIKDVDWTFENKGIMVVVPNKNDLENKEMKSDISDALVDNGYTVTNGNPEYVLVWNKWNTEGSVQTYLTVPKTSETTGSFGGINYKETTNSSQILPYSRSYNYQKLRFELFKYTELQHAAEDSSFEAQLLWDGFCSVDNKVFKKHRYRVLKSCLVSLGENREGKAKIIK